jgi:hypothetical protein
MSDREHHCPFLNRADSRCSDFFSIEQLQHAFEHCFHAYKTCAVYQELLVERQARRGYAAAGNHGSGKETSITTNRFVQVRIPSLAAAQARTDGYAKPAA